MLTGPDMAYLGSRVTFWCRVPYSSPPVTYKLLRDANVPVGAATAYEGNQSVPFLLKVTATSEGWYHCKAEAGGRTGVSNSIQLSVVSEYSTDYLLQVFESHFQTYTTWISSTTIEHQSIFRALPSCRVRGVTLGVELQCGQRLSPVLHLVLQQDRSELELFFQPSQREQTHSGEGNSRACGVLLLHGLVHGAKHQEVFQQHRGLVSN